MEVDRYAPSFHGNSLRAIIDRVIRPPAVNVSSGFKTRTFPEAVAAGLMWHGGDGHGRVEALRHECSEGDGLGPYGWVEHDGVSYGKQEVADKGANVRLVTSMVKPAQLGNVYANGDEAADSEFSVVQRSLRQGVFG